jgi:cytochrome c-type biogenesis protein CcmH/NrfF
MLLLWSLVTVWHMGSLHPVEKALTVLLAFGPFVVLAIVIVVRRRQDRREDEAAEKSAAAEVEGPGAGFTG